MQFYYMRRLLPLALRLSLAQLYTLPKKPLQPLTDAADSPASEMWQATYPLCRLGPTKYTHRLFGCKVNRLNYMQPICVNADRPQFRGDLSSVVCYKGMG